MSAARSGFTGSHVVALFAASSAVHRELKGTTSSKLAAPVLLYAPDGILQHRVDRLRTAIAAQEVIDQIIVWLRLCDRR